jgi:outer membrane protein assembly factor BamB
VSSNDGEQIWKTKTSSIVWSSPVIHNEKVYIGSGEGVMYCLDLYTGEIINRFQTSESIFSSPVISDSLLFFGSGNGLGVEPSKVDVVLGKNENGLAAAWVKKYDSSKGGGFVQIWLEQDGCDDLSYILKVAEFGFE